MKTMHSPIDEVNVIAKLADLKNNHYQNTLVLSALIELLVEKRLMSPEEIHCKIAELDKDVRQEHPIS